MSQTKYRRQPVRRKKRSRRKRIRFLSGILVALVLCIGIIVGEKFMAEFSSEEGRVTGHTQQSRDIVRTDMGLDLDNLYSKFAIVADLDSGEIMAERNGYEKMYPASMTKIMTAIVAIENSGDLSGTVTVPPEIFRQLYAEDASMAGFEPGEKAALKDLLYGILLPSGGECCLTFANQVAGSESKFVDMMNEKAKELGMDGTHFCNSTGIYDPKHYSTVRDIAVLLEYALKNPDFREAFCSSSYSTSPSAQHPDGFTFYSTMFEKMDSAEVAGGEILGGKTGYTKEAGLCLASLADVNGKEYILVTAKADGTHETEPFHILDAIAVYNQICLNCHK